MNHLTPPALPPPDACMDVMAAFRRGEDGGDGNNFRIADRLELHMPRDAPFVRGASGAAVVVCGGVGIDDDAIHAKPNTIVDIRAYHITNKPTTHHTYPDQPQHPAAFGAERGAKAVDPTEPCRMEGWARFRDGRWPCLRSMALYNDGFPAPIHSHAVHHGAGQQHGGLWVWVPTLELSTHFWERPPKRGPHDAERPAPYLRVRFTTAFVRRGLLMCDSEVWDGERPTLYSSSRQYARILVPRSTAGGRL